MSAEGIPLLEGGANGNGGRLMLAAQDSNLERLGGRCRGRLLELLSQDAEAGEAVEDRPEAKGESEDGIDGCRECAGVDIRQEKLG